MTYEEYRKHEQDIFNELPVWYAFGDKQFDEQMRKHGLEPNDYDKIYKFGNTGGFYLRSDSDKIKAYFDREDKLPELMKDKEFAVNAFYYEMCNHEYAINWQADWNVCSCFGYCKYAEDKTYEDYLKENSYSDDVIGWYREAKYKYMKDAYENEWV